jgi:putative transposase
MTNHVHLMVDPGESAENISLLMKRLAGRHTRRINALERRTGTAWDGRFKCSPIETEKYLLACARYIELNPVRAKMVAAPDAYPWSSYRAKVGIEPCNLLDLDSGYQALAATDIERRDCYRRYVEQGVPEHELRIIRGAVQRNQLTGSESFIVEIEQRIGRRIMTRERGRPTE